MSSMILPVIRKPVSAFTKISKKGKDYWLAAVLIAVIIPSIISLSMVGVLTVGSVFLSAAGWLIYISAVYYTGRLLKGEGSFISVFSTMGYAAIPGLISSVSSAVLSLLIPRAIIEEIKAIPKSAPADVVLPLFQQLLTPAVLLFIWIIILAGIWGIVLAVLACRTSHKFPTWKAITALVFSALFTLIILGIINKIFIGG